MNIPHLSADSLDFPDVAQAVAERGGQVAVGGDLSRARLLAAYRQGIFPWYSEGEPIAWWALSPRMVLLPEALHVPHSLAKTMRRETYAVTVNYAFADVMAMCAKIERPNQDGTWITQEMQQAYWGLHQGGDVHSFEFWLRAKTGALQLGGGLYGVQIGRVFFGESMFACRADASKIAFVEAVRFLQTRGVRLIDCQMYTAHLARFGARLADFADFQNALRVWCHQPLSAPIGRETVCERGQIILPK